MKTKTALMTLALCLMTCVGLSAQNCSGTQSLAGDDLGLSIVLNGLRINTPSVSINSGDFVEFATNTVSYVGDQYFLVVEPMGLPSLGIPGICVSGDPASTLLIPAGMLQPESTWYTFGNYAGGAGLTFTMQAFAVTSGAANGAYATSDAKQVTFN